MVAAESEIMNPVGEVAVREITSRRVDTLAGKTIALMDSHKVNADVFLARAENLLKEQHGVLETVHGNKPRAGLGAPREVLDELGRRADAAIVAFGD
ncbi:MAG: hypothetical protein HYX92_07315 [Chloroflexi bacterium]|nr:hypothetical protein [Chloroflexota bacterium]